MVYDTCRTTRSRGRARRVGWLALLPAVLLFAPAARADPPPLPVLVCGPQEICDLPDVRDPTPEETVLYERELTTRTDFGLSTDMQVVRSAATYGTMSTMLLEIPLLPHEEAELDRRLQTSKIVHSLVGTVIDRSQYSGHWIDNKTGSIVVALTSFNSCTEIGVVFDEDPDDNCQKGLPGIVNSIRPGASPLRIQVAARSLDNLQAEFDGTEALIGGGVMLDVINNTVFRTGAGLNYASVDPDYRTTGMSFAFGGQRIRVNTAANCSMAGSVIYQGQRYGLGAGHCGFGPVEQGGAGGQRLGQVTRNAASEADEVGRTGECDCFIFGPIGPSKYTADVLVANNERYTFYSQATGDGEFVGGRAVCQNGVVTYNDPLTRRMISCGQLTGEIFKVRSGGFGRGQIVSLVVTTKTKGRGARPGDSGATVGSGRMFMGVLLGAASDRDGNDRPETFTFSRIDKFPGGVSVVTAPPR